MSLKKVIFFTKYKIDPINKRHKPMKAIVLPISISVLLLKYESTVKYNNSKINSIKAIIEVENSKYNKILQII